MKKKNTKKSLKSKTTRVYEIQAFFKKKKKEKKDGETEVNLYM